MITFEQAIAKNQAFIVSPGCKTENCGFFTNERVDKSTMPKGWYAYDIRHGSSGNFIDLEETVIANHAGTFLTKTPVKMNKNGCHYLSRGAGYTFA